MKGKGTDGRIAGWYTCGPAPGTAKGKWVDRASSPGTGASRHRGRARVSVRQQGPGRGATMIRDAPRTKTVPHRHEKHTKKGPSGMRIRFRGFRLPTLRSLRWFFSVWILQAGPQASASCSLKGRRNLVGSSRSSFLATGFFL